MKHSMVYFDVVSDFYAYTDTSTDFKLIYYLKSTYSMCRNHRIDHDMHDDKVFVLHHNC